MNTYKRTYYKLLVFVLSWITLSGCIQEIEVFKGSTPTLVVDGIVTNLPGPQRVKLSYSKTYGERPNYFLVEQALVKIIDDLGNEEILSYNGEGVYLSDPDFVGVVGRSYKLHVTLKTDESYESNFEYLHDVPQILDLSYKKEDTDIVFYADFKDNPDKENYYRWRYKGTFEVVAPLAGSGTGSNIPPKGGCGSVVVVPNCWVTVYDHETLNIDSDKLFNGRLIEDSPIFSVVLDSKFNLGYTGEVQQYSLTKEAYEYWKALKDQIGNNGTIFETSNYQIRGNIQSLTNSTTNVLGYFGASAVSSERIFIYDYRGTFEQINCNANEAGCVPGRCLDCRKYSGSATSEKPSFWP